MSTIKANAVTGSTTNSALTLTGNGTGGVKVSDYFVQTKGSDIASATSLTLGKDGNAFDVTGTTTITSIGTQGIGSHITLQFDAALTFTHHSTDLILPGAANITTAAGDIAVMYEYASGDWRCVSYTKASGAAVATAITTRGDLIRGSSSGNPERLAMVTDGNAPVGDGTDVVATGIIKQGTHTEYYDATSFRPTESNGCDSLSALETTAARPDILYLAFDGSADEFCQLAIVPPKKWNGGTITYRIHHTHPSGITTGVAWQLQGVAIDNDETIDVAYGSAVVITDTYLNAAEDMHITATSGDVTIGGSPDGGGDEFVVIRLGRDISDGADNTSTDAYLMGLEIDWTINAADDS